MICPHWHEDDCEICKIMPTSRCYCGADPKLCTWPGRLAKKKGEDAMTAIETMQDARKEIQLAMTQCTTGKGFIRNECKARYSILVSKDTAFKISIEWMEEMYRKPVSVLKED